MQATLSKFINANWYGSARWTYLLMPLSWLFALLIALRLWIYKKGYLKSYKSSVPIIIIGNISAGGTGKTPIVEWLASQLLKEGIQPGIVSRGYRGNAGKLPFFVTQHSDPSLSGDEPLMLARKTGCPVCVCIDRVAAVQQLIKKGVDIILADDGLQHYSMQRDIEIAVVDGDRRFGNERLMPVGPLREPINRLLDVDFVLVNGSGNGKPEVRFDSDIHFYFQAGKLRSLVSEEEIELEQFAGQRVWAVAGIGNPDRFARLLQSVGIIVDLVVLPDHGQTPLKDLRDKRTQPILMTEKDAMKYLDNNIDDCWYLPVSIIFSKEDERRILKNVNNILTNRKTIE
ncbi:MAG: tetraacyldisaccharide 4'-kinase [Pseudomonadota bacterium]|nr:tetraacyldisaccharide 4'-kinase [Pseudomonadota bacterium]